MENLPKWDILRAHYPVHDAGSVFSEIGGKVGLNYDIGVFNNACATRVSSALNGAGGMHLIPFIRGEGPSGKLESQVSSGKHKKWYIFRVKVLTQYLAQKYGEPERAGPADYKAKFNGRKGIIIFEVAGWADATGHADLWNGEHSLWKGYGGRSNSVLFWEAE